MPRPPREHPPRPGRLLRLLVGLILAASLAACAGDHGRRSRETAAALAAAGHLEPTLFPGSALPLAGFIRSGPGRDLTVYIEGDGRAYADRRTPADDPTPADPLGLALAGCDPAPNLLVLARPGQYLSPHALAACDPAWWTLGRYAPEVVAAVGAALDAAKARTGTSRLHLRGYSGGAALAVLVAAGRDDVADIVTLAGNLDTAAWTALHGVTPLRLSKNPADAAPAVAHIPQTHYVGSRDVVTPPRLCQGYAARMPAGSPVRCVVIDGAGHHDGLVRAWAGIVREAGGLSPGQSAGPGTPP